MSNSKGLLFAIGIGGLCFGALFVYVGWRLWREGRELRSAGVTASAKILKKFRKSEDRSWGGLENHYLLCEWHDGGQAVQSEIKVQSRLWRTLRDGSPLAICFVPGQLETARAGPLFGWKLRGAVGIAMMIFGMAALVVFPVGAGWEFFS